MRLRPIIGFAFVCVWAMISTVPRVVETHRAWRRPPALNFPPSRIQVFRDAIPSTVRIVGYATDVPADTSGSAAMNRAFCQYAIAPIVIDGSTDHRWLVGHFTSPQALMAWSVDHGAAVVHYIEGGFVLLTRSAP